MLPTLAREGISVSSTNTGFEDRLPAQAGSFAYQNANQRGELRMRPWQLGTAFTLGLGALTGAGALRLPASPAETVTWLSDVEAARGVSRETGKPLFVAFR
jgi:hypothetical protein